MKPRLGAVLMAFCLCAGVAQGDYRAAENALAAGDMARVAAELEPLVAHNDARALNLMGVLLQNGWGVPRDPARAAQLYARAGELGLVRALHNLGRLYRVGLGVAADSSQGARLWKTAGRQGYVPSQAALGALYHAGDGVPQDMFRAYFWWSLAARRMDLEAVRAREDIIYTLSAHQKTVADQLVETFEPDR